MKQTNRSILCPSCQIPLTVARDGSIKFCFCGSCEREFDVFSLNRSLERNDTITDRKPIPAMEGESTCFYHRENKAEQVCVHCGRLICSYCAVDEAVETSCLVCQDQKNSPQSSVSKRIRYDKIALFLSISHIIIFGPEFLAEINSFPFIQLFFKYQSGMLVTAPASLAIGIYGIRKERHPETPNRSGLIYLTAFMSLIIQFVLWMLALASIA